ncbi:MAG: hypothetical protein O3A00_11950 [Planctomycetota bacterium]|nr:hypothetical protein [Planctomycetota bacterium]
MDRPEFLAGTAVPDLLSVADRKVRMRLKRVQPFLDHPNKRTSEIAAGIAQHLHDDDWFHRTPGFLNVTEAVAALFRELLGTDDGFRPGFLGHIASELLLDAALIERDSGRLDAYYAAMQTVDAENLQAVVNLMGTAQTERLASFVDAFRQVQFLRDYRDPERLLFRLNQVMRRVRLPQLPDTTIAILARAYVVVQDRVRDLLPDDKFTDC